MPPVSESCGAPLGAIVGAGAGAGWLAAGAAEGAAGSQQVWRAAPVPAPVAEPGRQKAVARAAGSPMKARALLAVPSPHPAQMR